MTAEPRRPRVVDAFTGAAAGLVPGSLAVGAPLLGGAVGMPGSALRYVLLSAALLSGLTAAVAARRGRRAVSLSGVVAARCAAAACLLTAVAGVWPSVALFCAAVPAAAVLGAPALLRLPGTTPWYAGVLAGLGTAGAVTGALADRPGAALAVCGCAGAALVAPAAVGGGGGRTVPAGGVTPAGRGRWAPVGAGAAGAGVVGAGVVGAGAAGAGAAAAGAAGAAVAAAFFAAQDLSVFRFELLGGSLALSMAVTAGVSAGFFTAGAVVASRSRGPVPARLPLLLLALGGAVTACAVAASAWQLVLALAGALAVAAGCARLLCAGAAPAAPPGRYAGWGLVGAAAGAGTWESAGRLVTAGDALVLVALWPVGAAVAWTVRTYARRIRHDRKAPS